MKTVVADLFSRLKRNDESLQNRAIAELSVLLEQSAYLERNDEIWAMVLPDDLIGMRLPPEEFKEVLDAAVSLANSGQFTHGSRLSLVGVITRNIGAEDARLVMKWFAELAPTFTEQDARSFFAEFSLFLFKVKRLEDIQPLLIEYKIIDLIESFATSTDENLQHAANRQLKHLQNIEGNHGL